MPFKDSSRNAITNFRNAITSIHLSIGNDGREKKKRREKEIKEGKRINEKSQ